MKVQLLNLLELFSAEQHWTVVWSLGDTFNLTVCRKRAFCTSLHANGNNLINCPQWEKRSCSSTRGDSEAERGAQEAHRPSQVERDTSPPVLKGEPTGALWTPTSLRAPPHRTGAGRSPPWASRPLRPTTTTATRATSLSRRSAAHSSGPSALCVPAHFLLSPVWF